MAQFRLETEAVSAMSGRLGIAELEATIFRDKAVGLTEEAREATASQTQMPADYLWRIAADKYRSEHDHSMASMQMLRKELSDIKTQQTQDHAGSAATIKVLREQNWIMRDELSEASSEMTAMKASVSKMSSAMRVELSEASSEMTAMKATIFKMSSETCVAQAANDDMQEMKGAYRRR